MKKRFLALLLGGALCVGLFSTALAISLPPLDVDNSDPGKGPQWITSPEPTTEPSAQPTTEPSAQPSQRPSYDYDNDYNYNPSYNVNKPSSTPNGTVSVDKSSAELGETVTITATPNDGYQVGSVTVKDINGNSVTVKNLGGNKYSFTMPGCSVTIDATFTAVVAAPVNPFTDVAEGDYFYDAVLWAVENGITTGKTTTLFAPGDSCTRAQAMTFLWRAKGEPEPTSTVNPFTDVDVNAYYGKAVLWAVENEITTGTGDGTTFSPNDTVSRGQMVTFLWRAEGKPVVSSAVSFTDVDSSAYYAEAVQWANGKIVQGMGDGTFAPNSNCTRGQIVTMLFRDMV